MATTNSIMLSFPTRDARLVVGKAILRHILLSAPDQFVKVRRAWLRACSRRDRDVHARGAGPVQRIDYDVSGREAHRWRFDAREFMRIEPYDGYFALSWSSALPVAAVMRSVAPLLDDLGGPGFVFDEDEQVCLQLTVRDAIGLLSSRSATVSFLRLELADSTIIWQRAGNARPGKASELGQLALLARTIDPIRCEHLLRHTATPRVAANALPLIEGLGYIDRHVAPGPTWRDG